LHEFDGVAELGAHECAEPGMKQDPMKLRSRFRIVSDHENTWERGE
jgi:hypothetical protein